MLGVPIDGPCIIFGANLSVVNNAINPASQLKKKHLSIAQHYVREAVAAGIIAVYHINTDNNPSNPLTKLELLSKMKIIEEMFYYRDDDEEQGQEQNECGYQVYAYGCTINNVRGVSDFGMGAEVTPQGRKTKIWVRIIAGAANMLGTRSWENKDDCMLIILMVLEWC